MAFRINCEAVLICALLSSRVSNGNDACGTLSILGARNALLVSIGVAIEYMKDERVSIVGVIIVASMIGDVDQQVKREKAQTNHLMLERYLCVILRMCPER